MGITFIYITHDQEEALTMSDRIAVMRSGLFEQIGSPEEIYSRPATSFVARFVGNANVLLIEGKNLAIRSEHVDFVPVQDAAGVQGYPARIISRSFAGGQIRISAVLESGEEITACRQGIDTTLQVGMEVRACWAPENVVLVKDTG